MSRPFTVAIASEKGGVGKTTIATNLAVYLKALREELPVTIASFDNHFSIDQMFALGPRPEAGVSALCAGTPPDELAVMGQYGVQYLASARRLAPPPRPAAWLGELLAGSNLGGVLILDTRPILDWFTEAALLAADLVLVPVKDRAALVNAEALRDLLAGVDRTGRLWLLPSLVDPRARLNAEVRVHDFLVYAARERDYQLLDIQISKSPKVEGLASGFSSRIRPVLTHARNTAVHAQFRALAEFVLERRDSRSETHAEEAGSRPRGETLTRKACPVCDRGAAYGHFFFDLRSRRRGVLHPECFLELFEVVGDETGEGGDEMLALALDGPGLVGPECRLAAHFCDGSGGLAGSVTVDLAGNAALVQALTAMTGRPPESAYRELVLIAAGTDGAERLLQAVRRGEFARRRRLAARELRRAGLF